MTDAVGRGPAGVATGAPRRRLALAARGLAAALVIAALGNQARAGEPTVASRCGVVVSVSAPASEVGAATLESGGNAVDAAVSTAFALAVTFPAAGNLGGGGFLLVVPPAGRGSAEYVDYRETAPAAAHPQMFADGAPRGLREVGVPGTVRGLAAAHRRWGRLPWRDLVAPAVALARDGFPVEAYTADLLNGVLKDSPPAEFPELHRVFARPDGQPWQAGDRLVQPDLARTLDRIAAGGDAAFYSGETADLVARTMEAGGGLITRDDLAAYRAPIRPALHATYRGFDVYAPGAPSGGPVLVDMLNILECFDVKACDRDDPATLHLLIEAMRRAFADRARFLGDPDFTVIPPHLASKAHARRLAATIDPARASRSEEVAPDLPIAPDEGPDTTHFSVLDAEGMAVSNTYTLENMHGSRFVVAGAGFLLNDEMGDFNPRPGRTDRTGRIGTSANEVRPGKRMLSSQTPTIVARDGRVVLVTGSPGGRTIVNTVLQVIVNHVDYGMDARAAVDAPRLHHQWQPDLVTVEPVFSAEHREALDRLAAMGHAIAPEPAVQGDAHTIGIDPATGLRTGAADRRREGAAAAGGSSSPP